MAIDLIVAPEAELDISEAFGWYEARRPGLGEDFLSCIDACIQRIHRTPAKHAIVHEDYRRALVRRFPYAVFYEATEDVITVFCVFHTSRDPDK